MDTTKFVEAGLGIVDSPSLDYAQQVRGLAGLAISALPYPGLSDECARLLEQRIICDMFEGNRIFAPRYVLPDYEKAFANGLKYLELDPPQNLDDALMFLTVLYGHVPSVTTYPVYVGHLDRLLEPYVPADMTDEELDSKLRRFWIMMDRLCPDGFTHGNLGPQDGRVIRSIWRVERELKQTVPNLTLMVDPEVTPDDLLLDTVKATFVTGKPHYVNHRMMMEDHGGPGYGVVSCYNSMKVGGGSHTLVRLNLQKAADAYQGDDIDAFIDEQLPHLVEMVCELGEARIKQLVEESSFFKTHFLVTEGLVSLDRFSGMFGIFGLAECVNTFMERAGKPEARYGNDDAANVVSYRITERIAELVAARPVEYCEGHHGRMYLHSQSGIDSDIGQTAGTRIPIGEEPGLHKHITIVAPHHKLFSAGISDIFAIDETVTRNPEAMVDIIKGALGYGMRDFTWNIDNNEFIRITGYLVRKSDLADYQERGGARHSSDLFAGTAEANRTVLNRRVKVLEAAPLFMQRG